MIQMPTRSITRFFIPMIDVLTLLFCIFLLMPMVSESKESAERLDKSKDDASPKTVKSDEERAEELKKSLSVRVLEIDGADGKLYYRDAKGGAHEIRNQRDATDLITEDKRVAGKRELYYLVLYPRDPKAAFPTVGQKRNYDAWFTGVALGFDMPHSNAGRQP